MWDSGMIGRNGVATPLLDRNRKEPPELALPIPPFPAIQPSRVIHPLPETLLQPKSTGNIPKEETESAYNLVT